MAQATALTRAAPGDPELHYLAFGLAVDDRSDRALDELELAGRSIRSEADRTRFVELLGSDPVHEFRQRFYIAQDKVRLARSAQALLNLGWPGPHKDGLTDRLKMEAAGGLLAKGDVAGAKRLVFSVQSTDEVLQTLVLRKWAPVRETGDPLLRIAQAIAASDEATERALLAKPNDLEILLYRAQFLRSVARSSEALELLFPKANDLAWVKDKGKDGFWVVNEAVYALGDLKRQKEALTLMDKLLSLGLQDNPALISMAINSLVLMEDAGDPKGAADYAVTLATKHAKNASPYGNMWMWAGAVCGHAFAGNAPAAQPWLAKLKTGEKDNPAALTRALLCANDIDGAAGSVIGRLDGDDPDSMLIVLQDYSVGPELTENRKTLDARLRQVLARADVQAAIARHGRILKVPLSRKYWGMF